MSTPISISAPNIECQIIIEADGTIVFTDLYEDLADIAQALKQSESELSQAQK